MADGTEAHRNGLRRVREDVHIHSDYGTLYRKLVDVSTHEEWLGTHFQDVNHDPDGGVAFELALPMRTESARLRRDPHEREAVAFVRDGAGTLDSVTYAIHREGEREVHLPVEAAYHPAGRRLGGLLGPSVDRPHRVQALRDSLWNLKQITERRAK